MEQKEEYKKRKRDFKKNILLLISVILIFLIFFEIILRIFGSPLYGFQKGMFQSDELMGYKLSVNYNGKHSVYGKIVSIQTNSKGMRDFRNYSYEKSKPRILILGDSMSFGNGVEFNESYVEILRKKFNDEVEVINFGVPGYGINNEYLSFIYEGKKYSPDIILIQFTLNDFGIHYVNNINGTEIINWNYTYIADKNGFLESGEGIRAIHLFLLRTSRTYSFFYTKSRLVLSQVIDKYWKNQNPTSLYFLPENSSEYQEALNGYFSLIKKIQNQTNAKIILFIAPSNEDLISSEEIKKEYRLNYLVDTKQIKNSMKIEAKNLNITVMQVDLNNKNLFLPVDKHWTPEGNNIIAEDLYLKLKEMLSK